MEDLKREIDRVVDQWVSDILKQRILQPDTPARKIGLWDRFKKGLSNLFYGQDDKKNPYYWQNRLGHMGVKESFDSPLTLSEYSEIKCMLDKTEVLLEETDETERLQLVRIIRGSAEELKRMLYGVFSRAGRKTSPSPTAAASAGTPGVSSEKPSSVSSAPAVTNAAEEPTSAGIETPPAAKASASIETPPEAKGTSAAATVDQEENQGQRSPRSHAAKASGWFDQAAKAKSDDPAQTKPSTDWFDKNKVIRPEKIPHTLAWMSHRTDKTDDDHIVSALRTELNDNSLEILPKGARNFGLRKYLKQRWLMSDESLSDQLSKLGIEIKPKDTKKKSEDKPEKEAKAGPAVNTNPEPKPETKPNPERKSEPEMRRKEAKPESKPDSISNEIKSYEKGSEQEVISRLYANDGGILNRNAVKEKTKKELIDHLLEDLKGSRAPSGSHDRLLMWWKDNYEQSNDLDIVSELKSGNFLISVLGTILPKPEDSKELDSYAKKIERWKKIILEDLSNRI